MENVGFNRIREWITPILEQKDITPEQFARAIGISRAALYAYFSDRNRPERPVMVRICDALGVSVEEGLAQYSPKQKGRPTRPAEQPEVA